MTKRVSRVFAALLVLAAGAVWLVVRSPPKSEMRDGVEERERVRSTKVSPEEVDALSRLRAILKTRRVTSFARLESLVSQVSSEELWELAAPQILLIDDPTLTIGGWVRAAACAELGRRVPEEVLAWVRKRVEDFADRSNGGDSYVMGLSSGKPRLLYEDYPALFSVYRGWADRDPAAAAESLAQWVTVRQYVLPVPPVPPGEEKPIRSESEASEQAPWPEWDNRWKPEAYEAVFHRWAARDLSAALAGLPSPDESIHRQRAWAGIIGGVPDIDLVDGLLEQWMSELGEHPRPRGSNRILSIGADRLMEARGLEEILELAPFRPVGIEEEQREVDYSVLRVHIARKPESVIGYLADLDAPIPLAHSVAIAHPARTVEVLRKIPGENHDRFFARIASKPLMSLSDSRFPAPERICRLPDLEKRLEYFLLAVDASSLSFDEKEKARDQLEKKLGFGGG